MAKVPYICSKPGNDEEIWEPEFVNEKARAERANVLLVLFGRNSPGVESLAGF
jgi:hypothetical protein